jgi:hypothetical protein
MLFYKIRSLGLEPDLNKDITEDIQNIVANNNTNLTKLEHSRWVTEKLLLGFRPLLNDDEKQEWAKSKSSMKKQMKHYDIIPYFKLSKEEQDKDNDVNTHLNLLYEIVKKDSKL